MSLVAPLRLALLGLASLACGLAFALPADRIETPALAGVWSWTDPGQCREVYEYRADGLGFILSGEERTEMRYTMGPLDAATGFHTLQVQVLKDHGGADCTGSRQDDSGRAITMYVKFKPEGDQHIVCVTPGLEACFGPLGRSGPGR